MKTLIAASLPLAAVCCLAVEPATLRAGTSTASPPSVRLAEGGRALVPIVVPEKTSERVSKAAKTLADYLGRISGTIFPIEVGDGQAGIAVGRAADFPRIKPEPGWNATDPTRREDYLLRSHSLGVRVIGATDLAVEYAVWDLLHRLGYRQFFPGRTWEVVPRTPDLAIGVDAIEHPAFLSRDVGFGFGPWGERRGQYDEWCVRNRLASGGRDRPLLDSGHSYDQIVAEFKDEFAAHPEYLAEVNGKRQLRPGETKFCVANADLRGLVARYAVRYFDRHPEATSVTLEPSDGLGWCECPACRRLGSVSDRVVTLTNEAAAAVRAKHGRNKLISIYAYAEHSPPPGIRVDPQVVVSVATSMTVGGRTTDELMDGWRKQGAQLGVREYYGVYPWDRDLPGNSRTTYPAYIKQSIPHFHELGARYLTAESSDNWGPAGLSYYLMARLLWNPREAERVDALADDFLQRAFGATREPMTRFYRLIDRPSQPRLSGDLVGRMYRLLEEAARKTKDPAITARVDDLVLYARYVELYWDFVSASGNDRQRRFEDLLRFTYRMRGTGMVHSLAVWRGLAHYDSLVKMPTGSGYEVPEEKDPMKAKAAFTHQEVQEVLAAGIARNRPNDFSPISFSTKLVPARALRLPEVPPGNAGLYFRERATFYTWVEQAPADYALTLKAGLVQTNVGKARISIRRIGNATDADGATIDPDQKEHPVRLRAGAAGLHRVELTDGTAGTSLSWPAGVPWTIPAGPNESTDLYSRWTLYFYVPKGTKVVAGYADGPGELIDGGGNKVLTFGDRPDYFSVPVGKGQDGRLWKFANSLSHRVLSTVPPYLARDGRELLLPAEVLEADAPK